MYQPFYPTNVNTLMIYQEHIMKTPHCAIFCGVLLLPHSYICSPNCWTVVAYTTLQAAHIGDAVV